MSLLEHADHKKSGRALVIVSATYIVLSQCTSWFDEIVLFGLQAQINQKELSLIFRGMLLLYAIVFAFRVYQADLQNLYSKIDEATSARHAVAKDLLESKFKPAMDQLKKVAAQAKKANDLSGFDHRGNYVELLAKRSDLGEAKKRLANWYRIRGWVEYIFLLFFEVFVPLLFLAAALSGLAGHLVCPVNVKEVADFLSVASD